MGLTYGRHHLKCPLCSDKESFILEAERIGNKKHALIKYDQFSLNTSCFWGSTRSNITPVVQFHENFASTKNNKSIYSTKIS